MKRSPWLVIGATLVVAFLMAGNAWAARPGTARAPRKLAAAVTPGGGLQFQMTTNGYRFEVLPYDRPALEEVAGDESTAPKPVRAKRSRAPLVDAVTVGATLTNLSPEVVRLDYWSRSAADQKITFEVWDEMMENQFITTVNYDDADALENPVSIRLQPGESLRRTLRIPLKSADGPLPAGRYTIYAAPGYGAAGGNVNFLIVPPPPPLDTGIRGQAFEGDAGQWEWTAEGLKLTAASSRKHPLAGGWVEVSEVREDDTVYYPYDPFYADAAVDGNGRFSINAPAGKYSVTAWGDYGSATVEVQVVSGQFATTQLLLTPPSGQPTLPQGTGINGQLVGMKEGENWTVVVTELREQGYAPEVRVYRVETKIDADGRFVANTPPGRFKVTATRGYASIRFLQHQIDPQPLPVESLQIESRTAATFTLQPTLQQQLTIAPVGTTEPYTSYPDTVSINFDEGLRATGGSLRVATEVAVALGQYTAVSLTSPESAP